MRDGDGRVGLAERDDCVFNTEPYGPFFYTAEDVREILAFAKARHITVVPEIEMPGHVRALLAAHPEFSCKGDLSRVPERRRSCTTGANQRTESRPPRRGTVLKRY